MDGVEEATGGVGDAEREGPAKLLGTCEGAGDQLSNVGQGAATGTALGGPV